MNAKQSKKLCGALKDLTGLHVTVKLQKGAKLFEFSTPGRMVASIYTYNKAERWAGGFRKGRRYERETKVGPRLPPTDLPEPDSVVKVNDITFDIFGKSYRVTPNGPLHRTGDNMNSAMVQIATLVKLIRSNTECESSEDWRYEVQVGGDPEARFRDAEDAFRYVLWAADNSPLPHRVWDTVMETFVDSLDFAKL